MKSVGVLLLAVFLATPQNAKLTAAATTIDAYETMADGAGDGSTATNDPTETEVTQTDFQPSDVTSGGVESVTADSETDELTTVGDGSATADVQATGGYDVVTRDWLTTGEDEFVTGDESATGGVVLITGDDLVTGDELATGGGVVLVTGDELTITIGGVGVTNSDELHTEPPSSGISVRGWSLRGLLLATAVGRLLV